MESTSISKPVPKLFIFESKCLRELILQERRSNLATTLKTSCPSKLSKPSVGKSRVVNISIVVDSPAPLGPKKARIFPFYTSKEILFTAIKYPNFLVRFFTSIIIDIYLSCAQSFNSSYSASPQIHFLVFIL